MVEQEKPTHFTEWPVFHPGMLGKDKPMTQITDTDMRGFASAMLKLMDEERNKMMATSEDKIVDVARPDREELDPKIQKDIVRNKREKLMSNAIRDVREAARNLAIVCNVATNPFYLEGLAKIEAGCESIDDLNSWGREFRGDD